MKGGLIIFLAILVAVQARTCPQNAYMRERMAFDTPLQVLDQVSFNKSDKICAKEWHRHGTCCQSWNLQKHAADDELEIMAASKKLASLYGALKHHTKDFYENLMKLSLVHPKPLSRSFLKKWTNNYKINSRISAAKAFLEDAKNINALDLNFKKVKHGKNFKEVFQESSEKCWNTVSRLRSSSICSLCSGRAEGFFKREKGMSTVNYCTEALTSCYDVLKMTTRLVKILHWVFAKDKIFARTGITIYNKRMKMVAREFRKIKKLSKRNKKTAADNAVKSIKKYYEEFFGNGKGLADKIQQLSEKHTFNNPRINAAICDKFLNLAHKPFIIRFTETFHLKKGRFGRKNFGLKIDKLTKSVLGKQNKVQKEKLKNLESGLKSKVDNWRKEGSGENHPAPKTKIYTPRHVENPRPRRGHRHPRVLEEVNPEAFNNNLFMSSDVGFVDLNQIYNGNLMVQSGVSHHCKPMNLSLEFP